LVKASTEAIGLREQQLETANKKAEDKEREIDTIKKEGENTLREKETEIGKITIELDEVHDELNKEKKSAEKLGKEKEVLINDLNFAKWKLEKTEEQNNELSLQIQDLTKQITD